VNYQKYPDSKDTPSRKTRKIDRSRIWAHNAGLAALKRRAKKVAKRAAQEAEEVEE